ncbi:hypothetical protein ABFS83_04G065500 [Erythranthe nasuta]
MEFEKNTKNAYITAPTSPNHCSRSNSMEFYYSAPASPLRKTSNNDDFEFGTSKKFTDDRESHTGDVSENQEPAMAFADELFVDGLVMPLKLPPRLLCEGPDFSSNSFCQKSPFSSPRTVCRIPFSRKNSWNDDFDPFMVALEKVREEKRGRNSHYRRSRSHSPFRAMPKESSDENTVSKGGNNSPSLSFSGPLDFKGSAYARWVRDQTREGLSPKRPKGFFFRQRVRPLKTEHVGPASPKRSGARHAEESKVQKLKGFLLRYASFGRDKQTKNTTSEIRKPSYFTRLSFKFKGNSNDKPCDTNMAMVAYNKPSLALCLGYGVDSPKMVKCT